MIQTLYKIFIFMALLLHTGVVRAATADLADLTVGMRLEPPHLDPTASASASIDFIVYNNVFEGLTAIDRNGTVQPLLATDWTVSTDGTVYTFTLKQGVTFHDNTGFNADDVVFSVRRMTAANTVNPRKAMFDNIQSVAKINAYTVRIVLKTADSDFLYKMALPDAVVVAAESADTNTTQPIGTGPFIFQAFAKGDSVSLSKNVRYHATAAQLHSVKFRFIADTTSATAGILSGDIDAFPYFVDPIPVALFVDNPKLTVVYGNTEGETMVAINNQNISDIRIRRAMHHAIDKQSMIDLTAPGATAIGSHMPPHSPYYIDMTQTYPYDVRTAKQLLSDADAIGKRIKFTVPPAYDMMANAVADYLRKAGFKVHMQNIDWGTWLSQVFKHKDYDITVITHVEPMDYDVYANPDYYYGYDSAAYGQIIQSLKHAATEAERKALLADAQRLLSKDAVNVWLYQRPKVGVWKKALQGMWADAPVEGIVLKDVYWQ